jgi:ribonucleoside-diphosphate reductase alpha chain
MPIVVVYRKAALIPYEPSGRAADLDIPFARSLVDYIFRKLGIVFMEGCRDEVTVHGNDNGKGIGQEEPSSPRDERAALVVDHVRQIASGSVEA